MTGANTGIGKEIATELALGGLHVILACRSETKALEAIRDICSVHPNVENNLEFICLDLSQFSSVKNFYNVYTSKGYPIHVWVDLIQFFSFF